MKMICDGDTLSYYEIDKVRVALVVDYWKVFNGNNLDLIIYDPENYLDIITDYLDTVGIKKDKYYDLVELKQFHKKSWASKFRR